MGRGPVPLGDLGDGEVRHRHHLLRAVREEHLRRRPPKAAEAAAAAAAAAAHHAASRQRHTRARGTQGHKAARMLASLPAHEYGANVRFAFLLVAFRKVGSERT